MKNGYTSLPQRNPEAPTRASGSAGSHACPRITRTKLACLLLFVFLVAMLLVLKCINTRFSSLCCPEVTRNFNIQNISSASEVFSDNSATSEHTETLRKNHKQRRYFPQVIIIGVRKGGTRALLEFLNLHPQINAEKGEMHFFDDDERYEYGLDWYRRQMPFTSPGEITIEKTPAYFTEDNVPERIHAMNASCKFLIVLRDPTERAVSDYTQIYFNKLAKHLPFDSFEHLAVRRDGTVNKSYKAIRRSMYYKHMERWLRWFSLDQFHFVDGAELVQDPVSELSKVEAFMGLPHRLTHDRFYKNATRGFYCMKLAQKEKCLAKSKGRTHPDVDPQVIRTLRKFYRPLNQKFYSIVHRDFGWPTE